MRSELGTQLKRARSSRGLSLAAASSAAKISQGYLHKLEAGGVGNPSPRVLQRLSDVLGVPYRRLMELADYLLPGDAPSPGPPSRPKDGEDMASQKNHGTAPTNAELMRLLEAVRAELADIKAGQLQLVETLRR